MIASTKSRSEIAREECTRDPIFLLQTRHVTCVRCPDGYDTDGDFWWKSDPNDDGPDESDAIDDNWLLAHDCAVETWLVESVFATREEAEAWANKHEYRWTWRRRKWQVYCVPAEGRLAEILSRSTEAAQS